ncbi:MAG TPA: hypothetical protein PK867_01930, partial [Pirellulales bacterium]|nr:hypothetical protein [Pirellulales bacterium]
MSDAETNDLLDAVRSFYNHYWNREELQPLVLVFKRASPIETGLSVALVCDDGRRLWTGTWGPFQANGMTKSTCAPQIRDLPKWPGSVDFDVRVPLEAPQTIKTIREIPNGPVEVGPGVRWYIDHDKGI